MALANRVALIPTMSINLGTGDQVFNIACHQATCYWLWEEAKGTSPDGTHFTSSNPLMYAQTTLGTIAGLGRTVRNAAELGRLPIGTVLIFTGHGGVAEHSCVIASNGDIGGYNQSPWFFGGLPNMFSMHPRSSIKFMPSNDGSVKPYAKGVHRLIAVDEATAVQYAQTNF